MNIRLKLHHALIPALVLLVACGNREHILADRNFDELRLIEHGTPDHVWIATDLSLIAALKNEVYFIDNEDCHWTTPDYAIQLLQKGKIVATYGYCHAYQTNLDNLKERLHKTTSHEAVFRSKEEWQAKLKQLTETGNMKIVYTQPDSSTIYGTGQLPIEITDPTGEDTRIHTQKLTAAIKSSLGLGDNRFSVRARMSSPEGVSYILYIRCNQGYADSISNEKLMQNALTSNFKIFEFEQDRYTISYWSWDD